ncbi:MAG: hypothetical protein U0R19_08620 [Bryobacteraceae bacterium]
MTSGYVLRLVLLCLGSFYIVHLLAGLCARVALPAALRWARGMRPRHAADVLLALRLAPAAMAAFVVVALCIPSYLRFEPYVDEERIGVFLWMAAVMGVAVTAQALGRAVVAVWSTRKASTHGPVLRLTGILSPQVVVSRDVRAVLSEEQWSTVLRHEEAHLVSFDNLKRLLILLAPGLTPFDSGWRRLEEDWIEASERAADAAAVDGDPDRALVLAEALVRLARHGLEAGESQVASSFATSPEQLQVRVQCLLDGPPRVANRSWILPASGAVLAMLLTFAQAYQQHVHELLEMLVD